jgi:hypothetical protein
VNPISTPFYGTQRGADTQFGVDRMRQAIGRAPVGFAPEVLAKMQADADRRIGFGVDSQLQTAGRFGGAQGALLSQLATAGGATDRAGVGADITRMQQDRLRDDTRYADAMGQSLAQFGQAERGLESNEAGRRTSLEADTARFNASQDFSNQQANANRDLQGQGMNLDASQFDRQFQRSGEQQQFNNILQLLNSGQINDGQYRQMIQQLLRQQGGGMGNLPGFTGGMGGSATRAYARGTGDGTHPGGPALVGEEGPEIAILPPGTSVIPHKPSMAMMGMGGGMPAYKCGTPHYAGGTPDMFQGYTADQAAIAAQDAYRQKALDQSQTAAMANRARGAGGGIFGRGYFGNRVYTAPRPTWQNFAPKGLAEDVFYDNAQMYSTGPKGVKGTGAGSSGIEDRQFDSAVEDFRRSQAADQMTAAVNARGRHNNSLTPEMIQARRGQAQPMPMPRPRPRSPFAQQVPNSPMMGEYAPDFVGPVREYKSGTDDWQNMVGPPDPSRIPQYDVPSPTPYIPEDQLPLNLFPGDGAPIKLGGLAPGESGGSMTMGGRTMSFSDPEGARLAESRGALRSKITGGGLTDADLPALMGEYARTSIGDNQPDDLIAGGLRGLAIQQQFEDAAARNEYYRKGSAGGGPRRPRASLSAIRKGLTDPDPMVQSAARADLAEYNKELGVDPESISSVNNTGSAPKEPIIGKDTLEGIIGAGKAIGSFFSTPYKKAWDFASDNLGGSSANAGPPKPPNGIAPTPTPTPTPGPAPSQMTPLGRDRRTGKMVYQDASGQKFLQ